MKIFLVRHPEYANPDKIMPYLLPVVLSPAGRDHARRIGEWLNSHGGSQAPIYASPVVRTVQTAEIIASQTNSNVSVDENLIEVRTDKLQGAPLPEGPDGWEICYRPGMQEEGGLVRERMAESFRKRAVEKTSSILVSHGDPLSHLYMFLLKKESPRRMDTVAEYVQKGDIIETTLENGNVVDISRHRV